MFGTRLWMSFTQYVYKQTMAPEWGFRSITHNSRCWCPFCTDFVSSLFRMKWVIIVMLAMVANLLVIHYILIYDVNRGRRFQIIENPDGVIEVRRVRIAFRNRPYVVVPDGTEDSSSSSDSSIASEEIFVARFTHSGSDADDSG